MEWRGWREWRVPGGGNTNSTTFTQEFKHVLKVAAPNHITYTHTHTHTPPHPPHTDPIYSLPSVAPVKTKFGWCVVAGYVGARENVVAKEWEMGRT